MAEINAIEIANSSPKSFKREPTNEFELHEKTPILPKLALSNAELPNADDDRIENVANENAALKESICSPENQLKVFASALNGNSFLSSNLINFVCNKNILIF